MALFRELERRYAIGGKFDLDVCCTPSNCLVPGGLSDREGWDALKMDWKARSCFINPPWGDCETWLQRTLLMIAKAATDRVVWVGPTRPSQNWFDWAMERGWRIRMRKRVDYYLDGVRMVGMPLETTAFVFELPIDNGDFR